MRFRRLFGGAAALLVIPTVAGGQPAGRAPEEQVRMRYQIGVMERVLEQAVQHGAQMTGLRMQTLTPNLWFFETGMVRARGFRLEGYGMFFDVDVPALRRSMAWSLNLLNQADPAIGPALESLRQHIHTIDDRSSRERLERALKQLELQVGVAPAGSPMAAAAATAPVPAARPLARPGRTGPGAVEDLSATYTDEVKNALIDAMLDHSGSIPIEPDEWLTVAARDGSDRLPQPEIYDVLTITLRISGADLAAFRADRIDRAEARARVDVREF